MGAGKRVLRVVAWAGVALLQAIMTQAVTFVASLFFPGTETIPADRRTAFTLGIGLTFTVGIYLAGWMALHVRWLAGAPRYLARLVGTVIGVLLPFAVGALAGVPLEPGSPLFLASIVAGIVGYHLPGWIRKRRAAVHAT